MSKRNTILMVLFFAGLIGLWTLDRFHVPTSEEAHKNGARILPGLIDIPPEEIARVEVSGGPDVLVFERDGRRWKLAAPVKGTADRARVDALVANLKLLPRSPDAATIEGPDDKFGLTSPKKKTVRLYRGNESTPIASLEVGSTLGNQRYVRAEGGKGVDVADANVLASLDGQLADWREKTLFTFSSFEVIELDATGPNGRLKLDRLGGHHRIDRPFRAPAEPAKVEELIASMCGLKVADGARGFLAESPGNGKAFGLDKPARTIVLMAAGKEDGKVVEEAIEVGNAVPDEPNRFYARRRGESQVLKIDGTALARLDADPRTLRGLRVADVVPERVTKLRVKSQGLDHEIARTPRGWRVVTPEDAVGPADTQTLRLVITELATSRAMESKDPKEYTPKETGLDEPSMVIEAWEDSPTPVARVVLGTRFRGKRELFARSDEDPSLLLLPTTAFDLGPGGPLAFRDRRILSLPPRHMTQLAVRGQQGDPIEVVPRGEPGQYDKWTMIAPVEAPADKDNLASIDALFTQLRADTIVADLAAGASKYGLENPYITLTWSAVPEAGGSPVERTLRIGNELPGGQGTRYASVSKFPWIFALGTRTIAILDGELHDRQVTPLKPEAVSMVELTWPDRSLNVARVPSALGNSARWQMTSGSFSTGNELSRLDSLLTAMAMLRTVRYFQYRGPFRPEFGLEKPSLGIEVHFQGSPRITRLRIGALRPDNLRYATTEAGDGGAVFLLMNMSAEPWASLIGKERIDRPELPADVFAK